MRHGDAVIDVQIKTFKPIHVARVRHVGPYTKVGPCFEQLFRWADSIGARTGRVLTLSWDDPETVPPERLRSDACVELHTHEAPPPRRQARHPVATTRAAAWLYAAAALTGSTASAEGYLRTGVGIALDASAHFTDTDCAREMPAALYGCGTGGDGNPLRSAGDFASSGAIEFGVGYAVRPAVRLQIRATYRPVVLFGGEANFLEPTREQSVTVEGSSLSGLIEAEFDLPTPGERGIAGFHPFAGVGIGRARHRLGETRMRFPRTDTIVPGAASTEWAWTVTAGFSRALSERTVLDVTWRYADQGDVVTAEGAGRVEWRDGSRTLPLDLAATRAQINHHSVGLSVRYGW